MKSFREIFEGKDSIVTVEVDLAYPKPAIRTTISMYKTLKFKKISDKGPSGWPTYHVTGKEVWIKDFLKKEMGDDDISVYKV